MMKIYSQYNDFTFETIPMNPVWDAAGVTGVPVGTAQAKNGIHMVRLSNLGNQKW